jgi:formamidopyrimidine-DNA glycosylase
MYLVPRKTPLPKHVAVELDLGNHLFIFEDTRYFGRLTLDNQSIERLGPEPLGEDFTLDYLVDALCCSAQPIKTKLLDQALVAGVGNIYASEALFRAGVSPSLPANRLTRRQAGGLRRAIRAVLTEAITWGSTVPLNHSPAGDRDGLFYFGGASGAPDFYEERLRVYDRAGKACFRCGSEVRRLIQTGRSTFYCPRCQRQGNEA